MEDRKAGKDRSEAVTRWVAVGLALVFFAVVVSCGREEAGGESADGVFGEPGGTVAAGPPMAPVPETLAETTRPQPAQRDDPSPQDTRDTSGSVTEEAAVEETGEGATTAWEHYESGISAWRAGEPAAAVSHLREWVARVPGDAKGRANLARVLIELGRPREAKEHAVLATNLDPASASARRTLARALAENGDRSAALAMYEEALWIDPEDHWSLNNLGYLLILRGRPEEAVGPLALAVRLDSENAVFRANLGAALEGAGYRAAALNAFTAAIALDPGHARAAANVARLRGLVAQDAPGEVDTSLLADEYRREMMGTQERQEPGPFACPW